MKVKPLVDRNNPRWTLGLAGLHKKTYRRLTYEIWDKNLGQKFGTNKQTDKQTDRTTYRVPAELKKNA